MSSQKSLQILERQFSATMRERIEQLQEEHLRPKIAEAYRCVASCFDDTRANPTSQAAQHCAERCQQPVQMLEQLIGSGVNEFQERKIKPCLEQCSYLAQQLQASQSQQGIGKKAPSSASAFDLEVQMENCQRDCLESAIKDIDGVMHGIAQRLQRG